jgi:hypothetical protein
MDASISRPQLKQRGRKSESHKSKAVFGFRDNKGEKR